MATLILIRLLGVLLAFCLASSCWAQSFLDLTTPPTTAEYEEMVTQPLGEDRWLVLPEDRPDLTPSSQGIPPSGPDPVSPDPNSLWDEFEEEGEWLDADEEPDAVPEDDLQRPDLQESGPMAS